MIVRESEDLEQQRYGYAKDVENEVNGFLIIIELLSYIVGLYSNPF